MSAGVILITDPLPLDRQPTGPAYYEGQTNICPSCGHKAFIVGRATAECANPKCGRPMPLAHRVL